MNNHGEITMFSLNYFYLPFSCKTKDDTHKHNKQCYRKTDPVDKDDVSVRDFPEHLLNASLTTSGSVKKHHSHLGRTLLVGGVCCASHLLFGGKHFFFANTVELFATRSHHASVLTAAIFTKFRRSIFGKIMIIIAARCQILRLKCTEFNTMSPRLSRWI